MKLLQAIKALVRNNSAKKIVGVILVILGAIALLTPFTPGSWLLFIGLELLGIRALFFKKK